MYPLHPDKVPSNVLLFVCFIGLNVDFTGVVSTVGGGGVLRGKNQNQKTKQQKPLVAVAGDEISLGMICTKVL